MDYDHIFGGPIPEPLRITGADAVASVPESQQREREESTQSGVCTMTIVEFVEARIAEDEAAARAALDGELDDGVWVPGGDYGSMARVEGTGILIYDEGGHTEAQAAHIARWDPARVLAGCAAKRAIVDVHRPHDHGGEHGDAVFCDECQWDHGDDSPRIDNQPVEGFGTHPCRTMALIAAVYADHPDYKKEWAL